MSVNKILIACEYSIYREGLKLIVEGGGKNKVTAVASNEEEMFKAFKDNKIHILIIDMDIIKKSGFDVISKIKTVLPELPILVISKDLEVELSRRALAIGVNGVVCNKDTPDILMEAVQEVTSDGKYICRNLGEALGEILSKQDDLKPHERLSNREFQVMCMMGAGKTVTEIAHEIYLSTKTISTHRARILEKMNFRNNADLIRYAIEMKFS